MNELVSEIPPNIIKIFLCLLIGLLIGLEREWSDKPAGIRTFTLISVLGGVSSILYSHSIYISIILLSGGIILIITFSIFMAKEEVEMEVFF
jgi:hypothetical protein